MIFRYNYKSNDVFIHLIHYTVYLTALKIEMNSLGNKIEMNSLGIHTVLLYSTVYNL